MKEDRIVAVTYSPVYTAGKYFYRNAYYWHESGAIDIGYVFEELPKLEPRGLDYSDESFDNRNDGQGF